MNIWGVLAYLNAEDDIVLRYNINKIMNIIRKIDFNDYDIIFLGHCAEQKGNLIQEILDEERYFNVHNSVYPRCTHAYIITKTGAKKFVDHLNNNPNSIDTHVDESMAGMIWSGVVKSLSFHDTLVNQPWQEEVNNYNLVSLT